MPASLDPTPIFIGFGIFFVIVMALCGLSLWLGIKLFKRMTRKALKVTAVREAVADIARETGK